MDQILTCHFKLKLFGLLQEVATPMSTVLGVVTVVKILYTVDIDVACVWLTILRICITKPSILVGTVDFCQDHRDIVSSAVHVVTWTKAAAL